MTDKTLQPQHLQMLLDSGISEDVIKKRCYDSILIKSALKRLGFSALQCSVPTLLIPVWNINGEIALYHHRPDEPRFNSKNKKTKYEFPSQSSMAVDVHPLIKERVRDPKVPLFITEGVKKADSAISRGLCCIALLGVWNWRGTNEHGGKTVLPDWDGIAFKDRDNNPRLLYMAFDSDTLLNPQVYQALIRAGEFFKNRGARVTFIHLPHGGDGSKVGLDDYLAAGRSTDELLKLASITPPLPPCAETDKDSAMPYRETTHGLVWDKPTRDGSCPSILTNFRARIVAEVVEDDGVEMHRMWELEAHCGERRACFSIPAALYPTFNWVAEHLGAGAYVYPGITAKDHARVAIQSLSTQRSEKRVYSHTGWRQQSGGWMYLHGGGAIGHNLPEGISVHLTGAVEGFCLPSPISGDELVKALRSHMRLWELAPDEISIPVCAGAYRAVLGSADFSLFLSGPSNVFKSELAALAQSCFGASMDSRHLPGSWSSTDNALEGAAFVAKDALFVVDDFVPRGSVTDVQRLHAKADRVLRAQGNNQGRGRMNADGTLRKPKPPRGLILSTGEDVPQGLSLRTRMLILALSPGDIKPAPLTLCQQDARSGAYAQGLSSYIFWLSGRFGQVSNSLQAEVEELRQHTAGSYARTPEIVAHLGVGIRSFLRFAHEVGALTAVEQEKSWHRAWAALQAAGAKQAAYQTASEPARRFVELLTAAIASGRAHAAGMDSGPPRNPVAWGWRAGTNNALWQAQGERIGWVEGEDLYLIPDAAYNTAQRMGGSGDGDGISINRKTLHKRLHERGLLKSRDTGHGTLTIRRVIEGIRQDVLHLSTQSLLLMDEKPPQPPHLSKL